MSKTLMMAYSNQPGIHLLIQEATIEIDGQKCLRTGNHITQDSIRTLREHGLNMAGAVSRLTPEQIEVAELEAELDAAQAEGLIVDWRPGRYPAGNWFYETRTSNVSTPLLVHRGSTRLAAAAEAAEFARGLNPPKPKPKLPEPESMTPTELHDELRERGCFHQWGSGALAPEIRQCNGKHVACLSHHNETFVVFLRRALRTIRERDGVE